MANTKFNIDANETNDGVKVLAAPRTWLDAGNQPDWIQPVRLDTGSVSVTLDAQDASIVVPAETKLIPGGVTDNIINELQAIRKTIGMTSDITNYNTLSYGNMDAGFFGIIPAEDFITGNALCAELGITQGSSQFSNTRWLKFAFKDKIIITPMKPIRYSISWDHIYEAGAVYGDGLTAGESGAEHHNLTSSSGTDLTPTKQDANVDVNGLNYKVRLMRGAADDPTNSFSDSDRGSRGPENEWNALMLPIHERAVSSSWRYPEYAPTSVANWGINFSDGDLITSNDFGNGSYRWMQETRDDDVSLRVYRGYTGVSYLDAKDSAYAFSLRGFGPALVRG